MSLPAFTFIVPVKDETNRIDACLSSIRNQHFPQDQVEIIVPDQGSVDDTREKARSYGAIVQEHPVQRAIFSVPAALAAAKGQLIVIMAADNRVAPDFCTRMASAFSDPQVRLGYAYVTDSNFDYETATRYFNRFTDPFNHFIYGRACNVRDFHKTYEPVYRKDGIGAYRFPVDRPPLLALAQGVVVRAPFRIREDYADDVGCIFDLLKQNIVTAIVEEPLVDHYTTAGLFDVLRKFRPRIAKNFRPASSLRWRDQYLPPERISRRRAWPFYALSIAPPVAVGIVRAIADREVLWLYHPIITVAFAIVMLQEALKNLPAAVGLVFGRSNNVETAAKD